MRTGDQGGELVGPQPFNPRTLADYLTAIQGGGPGAIDAALLWCSARTDAALHDVPEPYRRIAVNTVDRAGNELRRYLGWTSRPITYEPNARIRPTNG